MIYLIYVLWILAYLSIGAYLYLGTVSRAGINANTLEMVLVALFFPFFIAYAFIKGER